MLTKITLNNQEFSTSRHFFLKICTKTSFLCLTFLPIPADYFCSVKFELQFTAKIEPQSVLACFTHWILLHLIVKTGLNGPHKLYTSKFLFICHGLFGKSGLIRLLKPALRLGRSGGGRLSSTMSILAILFHCLHYLLGKSQATSLK